MIALVAVLIAFNFLASVVNLRADLTEGNVYTLSSGTKAILSKLEAPVKIRLYYSQGSSAVPVGLKTFASRVEDLLAEYKAAARDKVVIEKFNPEPDSDAEDSAALDGVEGQLTNTGEKFYLGLSVSFLDQKAAIPVLTPDRERLLEYDLTRAIAQVSAAKKPVVGVMSALPVTGQPLSPVLKQQPTEAWVLVQELKRSFEVRKIELNAASIPDDIKVLLVIHPRDIPEDAEYAIDQFVLRGGKLIAFLDPYAYFDQQRDMQNPFGGNQAAQSTFYRLFKAWGVDVDMGKVIADLTFASGAGPRLLPTLLSLNNQALNMDDVVTSQVGTLLIPFGGAFKGKPAEGLTMTPLAHTSKNSMPVDLIIATLSGEPSTRGFQPSGEEMPLAIRLTGKFRYRFPRGAAAAHDAAFRRTRRRSRRPKPSPSRTSRRRPERIRSFWSRTPTCSPMALRSRSRTYSASALSSRATATSLSRKGLVEQFSGDSALISLRSRASFSRPLTVMREMEERAQQSYLGKIKELEDNLNKTQENLQALQKSKGGPQSTILTAEQQVELENFRKKAAETRRDLKELRKNLRVDSDKLEFWTKVFNIGLVPLLVALAGLVLAFGRRRQQRATVV